MRMMLDVFWNGMKRKSADLRGGRSALCLCSGEARALEETSVCSCSDLFQWDEH